MFYNGVILLAIIATVVHGSVIKSNVFELEGRIVGGEDTTIEKHPYTVSVRILTFHFCGGSIISEKVVVTAAHCIITLPAISYSVQYGVTVVGGSKNVINAEHTLQYKDYNTTNFNNDIGLVFLVSKILFDNSAQPIPLASEAPAAGVSAVITGWGFLSERVPGDSILKMAVIKIIERSTCQMRYRGINKITKKMVCAGVQDGSKDACKLDSGGPLVSNGKLVGIISNGLGCGDPKFPGVYTNLAAFKDWIESNMIK